MTVTVDGVPNGFGLGNGDAARIFLPDGTTLVDGHTFASHSAPSWSRCPDGTGPFVQARSETLGAANDCPGVGDLVINEVESSGDSTNGDWIEIGNPTGVAIDASGLVLKDNDDTHAVTVPAGTLIPAGGRSAVVVENPAGTAPAGHFGLGGADSARIFRADGTTLIASYSWTAHATTTYGRCPDLTGALTTTGAPTFGTANTCADPATPGDVRLNEVESNGDTVGDWVEITNAGGTPVDVSGWKVRDSDAVHPFAVIPAGTTLAPGGFYALYTEFPAPGFGLGVDDSVTLFKADGTTTVDTYAWTSHAATTYGRCPDATGAWQVTTVATRGGANACSPIRVNEVESSDAAGGPDWVEPGQPLGQ
ncbi:lamin tail domain-containing protein [Nocardioides sp. W3-2-3]|uniref:lamin tail domain-containing protein n=1 Tax=Nocardioides convexus TaxID=2712224 RepID=UPI002418B082|nr:lamin tail domain-containing protein [Nocardioides convexus]NHA00323.1 lamin tail domain-containing protein [Nocardioides convexus]